MSHTSVNCCSFGVDIITTDPDTGTVRIIQWTWEEVQAFVLKHGMDVTEKTQGMVDAFFDGKENEAPLSEGTRQESEATRDTPDGASDAERAGERPALKCAIHNETWPCWRCASDQG